MDCAIAPFTYHRRITEEFRKALLLALAHYNVKYVKKVFDEVEVTTYNLIHGMFEPENKKKISKRLVKVNVSEKNLSIKVLIPRRLLKRTGKYTYIADKPIGVTMYKNGKEVLHFMVDSPDAILTKGKRLYVEFVVTVNL